MLCILGSEGQLGRALQRRARQAGMPFTAHHRPQCDVRDRASLERAMAGAGVVINAAAYTAVDRAESEPEIALAVNGGAPGLIAECAARRGIPLIHVSTDFVFDGTGRVAYREDDPVNPISTYGRTKEAGERAVRAAAVRHVILRTAWVFDAHGSNFVRTMLRLSAERPELRVVADQHGGPTSADALADALLTVADRITRPDFVDWGTYHFTGAPPTTWYEFAKAILADRPVRVVPIATAEYPTPAKRPANSVLDCHRIADIFGIAQPDWHHDLGLVLAAIAAEGKQA